MKLSQTMLTKKNMVSCVKRYAVFELVATVHPYTAVFGMQYVQLGISYVSLWIKTSTAQDFELIPKNRNTAL
jgi:hypothetical protein